MPDMHEIDYKIFGEDLQFVEVELDPNEATVSLARLPRRQREPMTRGRVARIPLDPRLHRRAVSGQSRCIDRYNSRAQLFTA
jgi:hypothetical protein